MPTAATTQLACRPLVVVIPECLFRANRATRVGMNEHPLVTTCMSEDTTVHQLDICNCVEATIGFAVRKSCFVLPR